MTNSISSVFGSFASKKFSKPFQSFLNRSYSKAFDLDMSEFEAPESYESLNLLFTRKLKKTRLFDTNKEAFISPADSKITEFGSLNGVELMQIKGKSYSLPELLVSVDEAQIYKNGQYINFYLSPRDYHRFHAPTDLKVLKSIHVPGKLYPVNMPALNNIDSLFAKNERVLLLCEDMDGVRFYLIFVGALNVGKIVLSFDSRVSTNAKKENISVYDYEEMRLKKGDEIGMFEMGSSIVAVFQEGYLNMHLHHDQKVRFGETIAHILP